MSQVKKRRGSGRLSTEDAAKLESRLLGAAMTLFSKQGYGGTTMNAIAARAGASTKTVYARYANKAEMLLAVVRMMIDRIVSTHSDGGAAEPKDVEPRIFLVTLGCQVTKLLLTEGVGLNRLALAEAHRHPELAGFYKAAIGHGISLIAGALIQWRSAGLLPRMDDPLAAATLCLSMLTDRVRVLSVLDVPVDDADRERYVGAAVDIFLRAAGYEASGKV